MKVLDRKQITEVVINRSTYHTINSDGKIYLRISYSKSYVPNMGDIESIENKIEVIWKVYVSGRTTQKLTKKEVTSLQLEEKFQGLDIVEKNGNHIDYSQTKIY